MDNEKKSADIEGVVTALGGAKNATKVFEAITNLSDALRFAEINITDKLYAAIQEEANKK